MNIFALDPNPVLCAQYHCDKHVVKMVVEYAQILSTAHWKTESPWVGEVYRQTHQNTPCPIWVCESVKNYSWLYLLFRELCWEYTHRYGRRHLTEKKMLGPLFNIPDLPDVPGTPWPQVMPEEYRGDDPVEAYRTFYREDKIRFARWTRRPIPGWMDERQETLCRL